MVDVRYEFHVSDKRKIKKINLKFSEKDFFHLAGFQHLKDVALPRNRSTTIKDILNGKITDKLLSRSKFYVNISKDEKNIKERCEVRLMRSI